QQPLISSTGLGQEGLPLRRFALQCRVEQLLDLRPVGRAHVVMRLPKRAPARLQATGGSCGRDAWATEYHRLGLYSGPRKVWMKSLAEAEGRHEIMDRMSRLAPDARPRWGAMSVGKMICHLTDNLHMALGDIETRSKNKKLYQTFAVKHLVIHW